MPVDHLYVFFGEMFIQLCPFFDWVFFFFFLILSCIKGLYILEINSFVDCIIYKYFLPFCRLSFCLVYDFLCFAKAFKFN